MKGFWIFIFFCLGIFNLNGQVVHQIRVSGNKTTKESIIHRELTFSIGDTIYFTDTLDHKSKSENNLFNTSLFNFTKVSLKDSSNYWIAYIELQERWYIWPEIHVKFQERNFSEWWKNKNLSRVDLGLHLNKLNFLGRNQTLQLNTYYGFTESFGFQYKVPYLNKKLKDGFKIAANYSTQNEVFVGIENNEMLYIKNDSTPIRSSFSLQFEYFRRTGFYQTQFFNARFIQLRGKNILSSISNHYFGNNDSFLRFINLSYRYKLDRRFSQNYPLKGYFFDFQVDQFGLDKLDKSDVFVTRLLSSYRKYWKLGKRQFFASGVHINHYFTKTIPFNLRGGLGFNDYIRGYEQYIIFGTTSGLVKNNYKIQLFKPKEYTLPLIKKIKKFSKIHFAMYWNWYIDAGYVNNNIPLSNTLTNNFLVGAGTGIDWVTYYDVIVRTEYSMNQFNEGNFNISFVAPL